MTAKGKDAMEPGFAASEIDTSKPHPARMYDAYLDGKDNYPIDRQAVRQILHDFPEVRAIARERVGTVKPSRTIVPKTARKKPKHKIPPGEE